MDGNQITEESAFIRCYKGALNKKEMEEGRDCLIACLGYRVTCKLTVKIQASGPS